MQRLSDDGMWEEHRGVGIVGTRRRNAKSDLEAVRSLFLSIYSEGDIIVSGGCPTGADRFAEVIAKEHGVPILIHYPNWKKYFKRAGLVRNAEIARDSEVLIACVAPDRTGGTEDTIKKFLRWKKTMEAKCGDLYLI